MNRSPANIGCKFEEDFTDAVRHYADNTEVDRYNVEMLDKLGTL